MLYYTELTITSYIDNNILRKLRMHWKTKHCCKMHIFHILITLIILPQAYAGYLYDKTNIPIEKLSDETSLANCLIRIISYHVDDYIILQYDEYYEPIASFLLQSIHQHLNHSVNVHGYQSLENPIQVPSYVIFTNNVDYVRDITMDIKRQTGWVADLKYIFVFENYDQVHDLIEVLWETFINKFVIVTKHQSHWEIVAANLYDSGSECGTKINLLKLGTCATFNQGEYIFLH